MEPIATLGDDQSHAILVTGYNAFIHTFDDSRYDHVGFAPGNGEYRLVSLYREDVQWLVDLMIKHAFPTYHDTRPDSATLEWYQAHHSDA